MRKERKKEKKTNYWFLQRNSFLNSFKNIPTKRFFKAALFDLLMLVSVIIIVNASFLLTNFISANALPQLAKVYEMKENADSEDFNQAISELTPVINRIFWLSLIVGIITFLLLVFFISLCYGRAWCISLKKKFSKTYLQKYFPLNLLWFIFLGVVFFFTATAVKVEYATVLLLIEMVLILYLDPVLRSVFDENKKLSKNINEFFRVGKFLHWFILFIIVSLIIIFILLLILGFTVKIPVLFVILFIIFTVLFIGWVRNYVNQLVVYIRQKCKT